MKVRILGGGPGPVGPHIDEAFGATHALIGATADASGVPAVSAVVAPAQDLSGAATRAAGGILGGGTGPVGPHIKDPGSVPTPQLGL